MDGMKNKKNKIISAILAFLLSVIIVLCFALPALYTFVLSSDSILRTLRKTNYYDGVQENLLEHASDFLIPTGLPETVLDGVFPKEDVEEMVRGQIQGTGSAQIIQFIEAMNKTRLKDNIDAYLQEIGVAEGEVSEEQLDEIINALINDLQNYTAFPFAAQLLRLRDVYKMLMWIVLITCFILGAGMFFFIHRINKWKHILLRYVAYSFGGAVWMLTLLPFVIRTTRAYERVHISPWYVYSFCVQHIQKGLDSLIGCGIVALICMIILGVMSERIRKKLTSSHRRNLK